VQLIAVSICIAAGKGEYNEHEPNLHPCDVLS